MLPHLLGVLAVVLVHLSPANPQFEIEFPGLPISFTVNITDGGSVALPVGPDPVPTPTLAIVPVLQADATYPPCASEVTLDASTSYAVPLSGPKAFTTTGLTVRWSLTGTKPLAPRWPRMLLRQASSTTKCTASGASRCRNRTIPACCRT